MGEPFPQTSQPQSQPGGVPQPPQWLPSNYWDGTTGAITRAAGSRDVWLWAVLAPRAVSMEDTLDAAKRKFKETFEATRGMSERA
jgi:hypothetical protein